MASERKRWFGPHRVGFGWGPAAWQGWVVTIIGVLAAIAAIRLLTLS